MIADDVAPSNDRAFACGRMHKLTTIVCHDAERCLDEEAIFASCKDLLLHSLAALFNTTCHVNTFPDFLKVYHDWFESVK